MTHQIFEDAAKVKYPVDMTFHEMLTNLFNTSFLTTEELETICKAGELYAMGKCKGLVEALRMIEKHCISDEDSEGACFAIKNIVFNAITSFPQPSQIKQTP